MPKIDISIENNVPPVRDTATIRMVRCLLLGVEMELNVKTSIEYYGSLFKTEINILPGDYIYEESMIESIKLETAIIYYHRDVDISKVSYIKEIIIVGGIK